MRRLCIALAAVVLTVLAGCANGDDDSASEEDAQTSDEETERDDAAAGDDGGEPSEEDTDASADGEPDADAEAEEEVEDVEPLQGLALEPVAEGLEQPLDVAVLPGSERLLVAERTGDIVVVEEGEAADEPFLSLGEQVKANTIEQGLLGVAPHPEFPDDPRVFVFHSLPDNDNVLVSYETDAEGSRVDPDSRQVLVTVDKEPDKVRHNGGRLLFGPEGHLYVSVGDAARASVNGQDPSTLPGSVLRIDVDTGDPYEVPPGNPFADGGDGAPEVWWFGLRNPWRFSIDEPTGLAYIADVGQETVEEVNVVPYDEGGINFGWPSLEGTEDFYSDEPISEVVDPVLEVRHDEEDQGCSITGGVVYRGAAIPELDGHYLYADWCHGWVRSFRHDDGQAVDAEDWTDQLDTETVSSFGVDAAGEPLVVDFGAGSVSRIVPVR